MTGGGDITGFQGGSVFKIFTLVAALEKGYPLEYTINAKHQYVSKFIIESWLETDLSKRTSDWRLGAERYAQKFPLVLANDDTPEALLKDAEAELVRVRAEMEKLAGKEGVKAMLNRIAQQHPKREDYFATAAKDLAETTQFVRDHQLLSLGDTSNLKVIETPEFMRGIYSVGGSSALLRCCIPAASLVLANADSRDVAGGSRRIKAARIQHARPGAAHHPRGDARSLCAVRVR